MRPRSLLLGGSRGALGSAVALTEERATASFRQVEETIFRGNAKQEIETGRYDLERDRFELTIEEEEHSTLGWMPTTKASNQVRSPRPSRGLRISFGPVLDYDRPACHP
jgi:hypothetical protein